MAEEDIPFECDGKHNLSELVSEVIENQFNGCYGEVPPVSWTNRFLESYFGKYTYPINGSEGKDFIKINLVLNSSSVPREVVKYVIYHELLHKNNHTHDSAFREKEHLYPNWTEHERFLENKFPKFNIKYAL